MLSNVAFVPSDRAIPTVQGTTSKSPRRKYFSPMLGALLVSALALAVDARAQRPDPKPPQVGVEFFYPPSPIIQHGTPRLVYEMRISNYVPLAYVLDSIDVSAGSKTFTYSGDTLRSMVRFFGEKAPIAPDLRFEPGRSAVIYFMLEFDQRDAVPRTLRHTLHFTAPDGSHHALEAQPLTVTQRAPTVVAAPLRGKDWLAGDSVHNGPDAAHRRTILLLADSPGSPSAMQLTGFVTASSMAPPPPGRDLKTKTAATSATTRHSTAWPTARSST
jgi:hypothetical protein